MNIYDVYQKGKRERSKRIAIDPSDFSDNANSRRSKVLSYASQKDYIVAPKDASSAWLLLKPKKRGIDKVTPPMVRFIHELRVNENLSTAQIPLRVEQQFKVRLSAELIRTILNQKSHVDIKIPQGLRDKVQAARKTRNARTQISSELKDRIYKAYESGRSGSSIAADEKLVSSTVNKIIRKKYGYRK